MALFNGTHDGVLAYQPAAGGRHPAAVRRRRGRRFRGRRADPSGGCRRGRPARRSAGPSAWPPAAGPAALQRRCIAALAVTIFAVARRPGSNGVRGARQRCGTVYKALRPGRSWSRWRRHVDSVLTHQMFTLFACQAWLMHTRIASCSTAHGTVSLESRCCLHLSHCHSGQSKITGQWLPVKM